MNSSTRRGLGYALLGALMAASFLVPWKLAARYGDAQLAVLVMLSTAAAFNSCAWLVLERTPPSTSFKPGVMWLLAVVLSTLTLAGNYCSAEAVARMSGALLSVLQRAEVIVVALLGAFALRERVRSSFWIGTLVGGIGLVVLSQQSAPEHGFDPKGALFGIASSFCFGSMAVLARKYIAVVRPLALNALRLWFSVALWFVVTRRIPRAAELSPQLLLYAGLAGFFGPFLSRIAGLFSARHVPASLTAFAGLATPVLTLVLGFVLIRDLPSAREMAGGAIMLTGISIPVLDLWLGDRTG